MEFTIPVTDDERKKVITATRAFCNVRHISFMSLAMYANETGMSPSKVRVVIRDLIEKKYLIQVHINGDKKVKRYFYAVTDEGNAAYPL